MSEANAQQCPCVGTGRCTALVHNGPLMTSQGLFCYLSVNVLKPSHGKQVLQSRAGLEISTSKMSWASQETVVVTLVQQLAWLLSGHWYHLVVRALTALCLQDPMAQPCVISCWTITRRNVSGFWVYQLRMSIENSTLLQLLWMQNVWSPLSRNWMHLHFSKNCVF